MDARLVFDVGMNNGDDTAYYLSLGRKVIAIEASPTLVQDAQLRFNEFIAVGQLTVINVGIESCEGNLDFYLNTKNSVWNSFDKRIAERSNATVEIVNVPTTSIDKVMLEYGVPEYLKIDIEGHDIVCLSSLGNVSEKPAYVSAEVNDLAVIVELRRLGYTKFKLIDQFSFLPLELPVFPEYRLFQRHKHFRESKKPPHLRLVRKVMGKTISRRFQKHYSALFSYPHPFGSSGPYGENLPGRWGSFEDVVRAYRHYQSLHERSAQNNGYNFWVDVHATTWL